MNKRQRRTIHGIDPYAPGGIDQLLDFHRRFWGDAQMNANASGDGGQGGESGGDGGEAGGDAGAQQTTETQTGTQTQAGTNTEDKGGDKGGDNPWSDPEKAKAEIERLRRENASERTNAKTKAAEDARNGLVQELGKALGLIKDGEKAPDPEDLAKQVTEQTTAARQAQTELAVYRAAGKASADPDALLDSRAFLAKIADIDPTDTAKVTKAIEDAVKDNPKLRATQAAGRSGAEFNGGSGEQRTRTPKPLNEAVASHYGV